MFTRKRATRLIAATTALAAALGLSACGGADADSSSTTLSLVGFAVPKAGNNAAQKEFAKTDEGKGVVWKESYGASGDQSRAVAGGLKADYVHFSVTPDVTRLVEAGLVEDTWDDGEHKGIVTDSVVVLVVREGNPKDIKSWDDLLAAVTPRTKLAYLPTVNNPTGTMTTFFSRCAFIRPRISVRKSSRRSDQRMPPRATGPARR